MMFLIMMLSGALAGLGGACEVLGTRYRYVDAMIASPGYAWTGVITTLMAGHNPFGVLFSSFFFGACQAIGIALQNTSLKTQVTAAIPYAATILALMAFYVYKKYAAKRRKERLA